MESVFQGYNSCVFAYGQTGGGKTHTMVGSLTNDHAIGPDSGLIPRIFDQLITAMHERMRPLHDGSMRSFECHVSMLEIYNESIMDLLQPEHCNLAVREDLQNGVHVESLSQERVQSGADLGDYSLHCPVRLSAWHRLCAHCMLERGKLALAVVLHMLGRLHSTYSA